MSASRNQQKDLFDHFSRQLAVTHGTFSTAITLAGPIDVLQIQLDNDTSASVIDFNVFRDGTQIKRGAVPAGAGTREITFLGRELRFNEYLVLDSTWSTEPIYWTVLYRDPNASLA